MEADWQIEIGGDAPVIEACWSGFVDLRRFPTSVRRLPEIRELPGLAEALKRLNATSSPMWTSKCDVWGEIGRDEFDPDELDAPPGTELHAMACYIDLLPKSDEHWTAGEMAIAACKSICARLQAIGLRCCRVDLVIRRVLIAAEVDELGVTAYLIACGPSADQAKEVLSSALDALADAVAPVAAPEKAVQKLQ